MLHTDFFNKNNKRKMQKPDYVKNTSRAIPGGGISKDILEVDFFSALATIAIADFC
jgi:Sec7-like guanine-nucleotide exchange factor